VWWGLVQKCQQHRGGAPMELTGVYLLPTLPGSLSKVFKVGTEVLTESIDSCIWPIQFTYRPPSKTYLIDTPQRFVRDQIV
jgi:hypothetical protein